MDDTGLGKFILDKLEKLDDKLDEVKIDQAKSRESFDAHEDKDEDRHQDVKQMNEKICVRLDEQHKSLDEYNRQLEIHIKGVKALEDRQNAMWARVEPVVSKHEQEAHAKKWLSDKMKVRMKWIAYVGTAAGALTAVLKLLNTI